jgi:hypothetical protein
MGVQVTFNYTAWAATFPQFSPSLTEDQVTNLILPIAEQFNRNDGGGPVSTAALQTQLLNLMVAHVAEKLFGPTGAGAGATGLAGPITQATEGSVSVTASIPTTPNSAWFMSTPFGAMWWAMTSPFRTMRYVPGPRRNFNPWPNQ